MARTDDAGRLVSGVLMLGQLSEVAAIQNAVLDREDEALDRITDPRKRTEHALVAMAHAPIQNCAWWAKLATADTADDTLAKPAVVRLITGLPGTAGSLPSEIETAVSAAVKYLDEAGDEAAADAFTGAAASMEWTGDADERAQRTALYSIAQVLLGGSQAKRIRQAVVNDLLAAFDSYFDPGTVTDVVARVRGLDKDTAADVDAAFDERDTASAELVASTQVRLTARRVASLPALPVDMMLEALPLSEPKDQIVNGWVELRPTVQDYIQVDSHRGAATDVLGAYAKQLSVPDRTTLWCAIGHRGVACLSAVGRHGVDETAFTSISERLPGASTQPDRADLVTRALTARPADAAAARAMADLALALLATDVRGDAPLAAKLALELGDSAHGRMGKLRAAFDAEGARPNNKLTKKQVAELRQVHLMSKQKKRDVVSRTVDSVRRRTAR